MKFSSKATSRIAAMAMSAVVGLSLAACGSDGGGSSDAGASKDVRVAFVGSRAATYQQASFEGLNSVEGIDATFVDVGYDVAKQVQAMSTAVASGQYDAIVVTPNSPTGLIKSVNDAIAKDLIVVNVAAAVGEDGASTKSQIEGQAGSVLENFETMGEELATLALKYCEAEKKSPCDVARIGGLPQFLTEKLLQTGMERVVDADGSATITELYAGGFDANAGIKGAQDLLAAHPEIDVIAANEYVLTGALQAAKGRDIGLIALGGSENTLSQVKSGGFFGARAFFPYTEGVRAGEIILKKSENPGGDSIDMGSQPEGVPSVFTKDTIGSHEAEYK